MKLLVGNGVTLPALPVRRRNLLVVRAVKAFPHHLLSGRRRHGLRRRHLWRLARRKLIPLAARLPILGDTLLLSAARCVPPWCCIDLYVRASCRAADGTTALNRVTRKGKVTCKATSMEAVGDVAWQAHGRAIGLLL